MATRRKPTLPKRLTPRRVPSQSRSRALVDAILEAGAAELITNGYESMTLAKVATRAGVSPGSLYQYFPDKAALVTALIEAQSQRELEFHLERAANLEPNANLETYLEHMVRTLVEFQRREGPLMRQTLASLKHVGRYEQLVDRARQASAMLGGILEQHREELAVDDVALALHVVSNTVHSLTHDGLFERPASLDDDTLVREVMRLLRGYLLR